MLKNENLIRLIASMSKSEKRNFKLLAQKTGSSSKIYVLMFDFLDKYQIFDENLMLQKIPSLKKTQISNQKSLLCKQILRALRDINKEEYPEIKAREKFDFAKVLYAKGQYQESLSMLQEVKQIAFAIQLSPLAYLAINFEKQIEAQHITKSMTSKAYDLADSSNEIVQSLILTDRLSNVSLLLYARYLEQGIVKNHAEFVVLDDYFKKVMPKVDGLDLDFYQKLYLYQANVWYAQMAQDWPNCFKYAQRWVNLFDEYPNMKVPATTQYIRGMHNILNALFMSNKQVMFNARYQQLVLFNQDEKFKLSLNEKNQLNLIRYTHGLNSFFLNANYDEGLSYIQEINRIIDENEHFWDLNRKIVFDYKIACIYFGNGDLKNCIMHLNRITDHYYPKLKPDIQCYARILNLIAHYDLGNEFLVSYKIKSVFRFLLNLGELEKVQLEVLRFIRRTPKMDKYSILGEFNKLREKLVILENDQYEKRPFLFLDIISWLDSKIKRITMVEAIRIRRNAN